MAAYYNEIDPKAAAWLRELIRQGHIAPGDVDERSIEDIAPYEIAAYRQCHFFAGIGVWSYALRRARWPDERRVWTGSCPCQPLSQAGKGLGFADERHLWPAWEHLIRECRPPVVFGEQVASKAADSWADLVQDDMEAMAYAFGAVPFPAASVGAPHIRDRLYWLADHDQFACGQRRALNRGRYQGGYETSRAGSGGRVGAGRGQLAHPDGGHPGAEREQRGGQHRLLEENSGAGFGLAHDHDSGRVEHAQRHSESPAGLEAGQPGGDAGGRSELGDAGGTGGGRDPGAVSRTEGRAERCLRGELDFTQSSGRVGDDHDPGLEGRGLPAGERGGECTPWSASDFVWCRDGKWRPVEPGTFPLVNGAPERVGRLRGYGNAIVAEAAKVWIETYLESAA